MKLNSGIFDGPTKLGKKQDMKFILSNNFNNTKGKSLFDE